MMIQHYLKVACRNLLKYKMQSIISMIGLAIGFTCFTLALLWIRYEMTYDDFHDGADRTFLIYQKSVVAESGFSTTMAYPVSTHLKEKFPEVETSCAVNAWRIEAKTEDQVTHEIFKVSADSCFMNMFKVSILEGNADFLDSDTKIAITPETSKRLFGVESPLGKELEVSGEQKTICAIVDGWGEHSNLPFGLLDGNIREWHDNWSNLGFMTYIRLKKAVDTDAFSKKLDPVQMGDKKETLLNLQITPITRCHYTLLADQDAIKFNYLILFSIAGGMVILCALSNYLALFISRLRLRAKEMALRKVCGSSCKQLFVLFCVEFLLLLFFSCLMGVTFLELSYASFEKLSGVKGSIYLESLFYFGGLILFAMILFLPTVNYFYNRTLQETIHGGTHRRGNRQLFRKASIIFQLVTSIIFIFCICIMLKQTYYLSTTDIGMERKNIATLSVYPDANLMPIGDQIERMPCVTKVLKGHISLMPRRAALSLRFSDWEGKQSSDSPLDIECLVESEALANFYGIKLLKGEMMKEGAKESEKIVINETAAKVLGWNDPVGKKLLRGNGSWTTVVGMVKDFHTTSPTTPVKPMAFIAKTVTGMSLGDGDILIKHGDEQWLQLKNNIDSLLSQQYPEAEYWLSNMEETYSGYLKSEHALIQLLSFIAGICMLISAFGIFSLITFTCEQRRKEIAIRKVNGASVGAILNLFVKEYLMLLISSACIAFPIGYVLMKRWLQSYVEQIEIEAWIYVLILALIIWIIAISISWRIWKAIRQNPAEVIKSE